MVLKWLGNPFLLFDRVKAQGKTGGSDKSDFVVGEDLRARDSANYGLVGRHVGHFPV